MDLNAKQLARKKKKMTRKNSRVHSTRKGGGAGRKALPRSVASSATPIAEEEDANLSGADFARRPKTDNAFRYEHESSEESGEEEEESDQDNVLEMARLAAIRLDEEEERERVARVARLRAEEEEEERLVASERREPEKQFVTGEEDVDQLLDMFDEMT